MDIKSILKRYTLTQGELAERLGINRVSMSRLLSERNDMRISTAKKIAAAIGCDIAEFFQDEATHAAQEKGTTPSSFVCPKCGAHLTAHLTCEDE